MGENHLKRETPFQCQIRFFNTLPEVSSQDSCFTALLTMLAEFRPDLYRSSLPHLLLALKLLPEHQCVVVHVQAADPSACA